MIKPFIDVVGELAFTQLWQVRLVVAAAALVTRFACARRAHLAHLVWLMVLIKCLTPPLWSSPTGVFSWAMQRSTADAKSTALIATSSLTARAKPPANLIDQGPGSANLPAAGDRLTASETPMTSPAAVMRQGPLGSADISRQAVRLLLLAWAAGAAAFAGFAMLIAVGSWRAVRRSRCPDDESATAILEKLARRLAVRRKTRLMFVSEPLGPMTFGWIRPAIIVPEQLIVGRLAAEIEPLLAHELIHVRRGDALVGLLQLAAQCMWWFHPLVWWANRELGRERERCCDEEVVAGLACPPATYARSLLNVLELKRQLRWLGPLPGLRPFEVTKQRLERLMTHSADFRPRMPRAYWLLLLAGVLVFVPGGRLARSTEEPPASASKSNASAARSESTHPGPSSSGSQDVSAAAVMKQVYDSFGWIDQAKSFQIRTQYKIRPTAEALRRDKEHPHPPFGALRPLDPRTFHVDSEWAWDQAHIRYAYQNYYDGESLRGCQTRVWDGSLAVGFGERSDHTDRGYGLADKPSFMFPEQDVAQQLMLPWGPGGPHGFWWLPTNVARYRETSGLAPEDFTLAGEEPVDGRPCRVVETAIGGYRLHVGTADGRLYRRTWLVPFGAGGGGDQSLAFQKAGGPAVKNYLQFQAWLKTVSPAEQAHAGHRLMTALAEQAPPKRAKFYETFADYREVAPGRWLPFQQTVENFSFEGSEPFVEAHIEQQVTEVHVDTQLPKDLFHVELEDGVPVRTDWRYDPPIHYTYRKDQTEAERAKLQSIEQNIRGKQNTLNQMNQMIVAQSQSGNGEGSRPTRKTAAAKSTRPEPLWRLIESVPQAGQSDVSPDLKEIRITFDRDMGKGMSWTGSPESFFPPGDESRKARWINARTCVLPVKLEKGKYYRVGINSSGYRNFRSALRHPFPPAVIYFTTEGASAEEQNRLRVPKIVELKPANRASDVDPSITELRVTFDIPMGEGMSWTGAGPRFPGRPGARAKWSDDHKTWSLPASLVPRHSYSVGLNDVNYNNFQSESGVPLEPVFYRFKTR